MRSTSNYGSSGGRLKPDGRHRRGCSRLRAFAFFSRENAGMADAKASRNPFGRNRIVNAIVAGAIASAWVATIAAAQSVDPVYKGKQIKMIIPSGAGGGYDSYARSLARH